MQAWIVVLFLVFGVYVMLFFLFRFYVPLFFVLYCLFFILYSSFLTVVVASPHSLRLESDDFNVANGKIFSVGGKGLIFLGVVSRGGLLLKRDKI